MITQTAVANPMWTICIHIGSDETRVINQSKRCQSPGCPSYFSFINKLHGEGLYNASINAWSSSRHIAWCSALTMLMPKRTANKNTLRCRRI